jgi:hypothetical protein
MDKKTMENMDFQKFGNERRRVYELLKTKEFEGHTEDTYPDTPRMLYKGTCLAYILGAIYQEDGFLKGDCRNNGVFLSERRDIADLHCKQDKYLTSEINKTIIFGKRFFGDMRGIVHDSLTKGFMLEFPEDAFANYDIFWGTVSEEKVDLRTLTDRCKEKIVEIFELKDGDYGFGWLNELPRKPTAVAAFFSTFHSQLKTMA